MSVPDPKDRKGQIVLFALVLLGIFLVTFATLANYVGLYASSERRTVAAEQALQLAEAGMDKAVYELNQDVGYTGETNTPLGSGVFTTTVSTIDASTKRITATGFVPSSAVPAAYRTVKATVTINPTVISFRYGIQSGNGGFVMQNSSSVTGNVFSGGSVTGSGNYINGDVISSGPSGLIDGVHATGTAYAHNIRKSSSNPTIIDKDAYYVTIDSGVVVNGTKHPGSPDQNPVPLPISDTQISQWENDAASTVATCSGGAYTINSDVTIGPLKIPCNLDINGTSGGITVTIAGPVWVVGNISTSQKSTIRMASDLGSQNVAVIADDPTAPTTSGTITITQQVAFQGSGAPGSFVFMISQNSSAENGGSLDALTMNNGSSALVAYASHGQISLSQSTGVKEVTAYKIVLKNSANVTYDRGLPSTLFEAGSGGSWAIAAGTYSIAH